ncbi:carboxylesterase/lipase family protein [Microbacterium lushaniae]|uniref:Carboxylic ester hydrolase n=1 Tax=Microbacterium lushaniae TaxID=2614639 RepID=A0A5J6L753_9MICO|nr:carboxylesterase family protein [Microbacterium lushaniae]QEW04354.1 carboxylesterase/lipase family protein [Microbacterium lushaniae]
MTTSGEPVVRTRKGVVRGIARDGSTAFLGIPYAQAPVGALRFAAPVPPEPWAGVLDATAFGPTPQRGDAGTTLIPEPSVPGEATLNVNVFTPRVDEDAALPVLVYLHGGGYVSGSPASPWYDGAAFARDGVVTVTVSYRLGFDGFGEIEDAPSNRAVRDWLAALRWVQDEIRAFGGDPAKVTLAGQSAGGGAALTLLSMPAARGLFRAVLAISPALTEIGSERARAITRRLAAAAGVPATREGFASVPEERLFALQEKAGQPETGGRLGILTSLLNEGLPWGPVIDGDLVPEPVLPALAHGEGSAVPLVLGTTDDEFTMATARARGILGFLPVELVLAALGLRGARQRAYLRANRAQRRKGNAAVLGRYATDLVFRADIPRVAAARGTSPTWVYRFGWTSPVIGWACHCLDVPFWFDCLDAPGVAAIAGDAPPRGLADALHSSAVAFVRDGAPGWEAWSERPGTTRVFGGPPSEPDVLHDGYASVMALH